MKHTLAKSIRLVQQSAGVGIISPHEAHLLSATTEDLIDLI